MNESYRTKGACWIGLCLLPAGLMATEAVGGPPEGNRPAAGGLSLALENLVGLSEPSLVRTGAEPVMMRPQDSVGSSDTWYLAGPYFLRSADPEPLNEIELKFIYGYETSSNESDEHEVEFELEWGFAEGNHFILEVEGTIGNGGIEGNGDVSALGLHTRFWEEDGVWPAFAMRNLVRIPTGYKSSGVDYTARGLFTKSIVPGKMRLHANPFITFVSGDNEEEDRDTQWGIALGFDYRLDDDVLMILDYQLNSSEENGHPDDHQLEWGADIRLENHRKLGLAATLGLDGDDSGSNFGFRVSYIISIEGG